jgi:hypothetical protein
MSIVIEIKTKSLNGLPIRTIQKSLNENEMELIEGIEFNRIEKRTAIWDVTMHESVNPSIELKGE